MSGQTIFITGASAGFGALLIGQLDAIADGGDVQGWEGLLGLLQVGSRLGLSLPERDLQDRLFGVLRHRVPHLVEHLRSTEQAEYHLVKAILALAVQLRLDTGEWEQRLRPLEEPLAADPAYWP